MERMLYEAELGLVEICEGREYVKDSGENKLKWLENDEIGSDTIIETAFGQRKVCYCDYASSSRALKCIEKYVLDEVLPLYGNTHSSATATSEQSSLFLDDARDVIRSVTGASEQEAVLFIGSGTAFSIHTLIHYLNFQSPPIIVSGIQAHDSNLLQWRKICKDHYIINETDIGTVDCRLLERLLQEIRKNSDRNTQIIGCFSAVSNITGIIMNIDEVCHVLNRWRCLSFWDYASAAPFLPIEMCSMNIRKDAIYFSGHKLIGGIQSPGVLIINRKLIDCQIPHQIDGENVSDSSHSCLKEIEYQDEEGTSNVVGCVRLAMAFKLLRSIGYSIISERVEMISRSVIHRLSENERIVLLGAPAWKSRLPIFSFLIYDAKTQLFLHHNYVSALLNDLFGIQTRAGCACTGSYGQHLLGISKTLALQYCECHIEDARLDQSKLRREEPYRINEVFRPGFTTISFSYFTSPKKLEFVLKAIEFVAQNGISLINQYKMNSETAEWHHFRQRVSRNRKSLGFVDFTPLGFVDSTLSGTVKSQPNRQKSTKDLFEAAENIIKKIEKSKIEDLSSFSFGDSLSWTSELCWKLSLKVPNRVNASIENSSLRWFLIVYEAENGSLTKPFNKPFHPKVYTSFIEADMLGIEAFGNEINIGYFIGEKSDDNEECEFIELLDYRVIYYKSLVNVIEIKTVGTVEKIKCIESDRLISSVRVREICVAIYKVWVRLKGRKNETVKIDEIAYFAPTKVELSYPPLARESRTDSGLATSHCEVIQSDVISMEDFAPNEVESSNPSSDRESRGDSGFHPPCFVDGSNFRIIVKAKEDPSEEEIARQPWIVPPRNLYRIVKRAITIMDMIEKGDRVLVCLSGGKDSLSLLHILKHHQFKTKTSGKCIFELGAVTVDPKSSIFNPKSLIAYCESLNINYFYEIQDVLDQAAQLHGRCGHNIRSLFSRLKRDRLIGAAKLHGYNVLALAHHLDDVAETFLMSAFRNSALCVIKGNYTKQEIKVIRPVIYVREKVLHAFAERNSLPVIKEKCPVYLDRSQERHRLKEMLASYEASFPQLFASLKRALEPLITQSVPQVKGEILETTEKLADQWN